MKRIIILFSLLIACITYIYSQDTQSSGLNYNELASKLEKSNKALENPKKVADTKFWIERGKLLQDIADVNTQYLRIGLSQKEAKLFCKDPKEVKKDGDKEDYIYERFIAYFKDGKLVGWKETQTITPNPLDDALNSYHKAIDLDAEKKNEKKIAEGLKSLKGLMSKQAVNCYSMEDYACAADEFKKLADMQEIKLLSSEFDTAIVYNAGFTALQAGKTDDAINYLNKVAALKYKGDPFLFANLKKAYLAKGDTLKALNALKQGIELFPRDINIIIELINFYITTGEKKAALEYLARAKENDPKNRSFYYAEGALYDKMTMGVDLKITELANQKSDKLKQLDENKKEEFRKTGNNVQKYKPIDEKYQKLKKDVEDQYKTKEDSLYAEYTNYQSKAIEQYKKAVEVDPDYFDAYYNLGVLFFNNGVKLSEQAGKEVDDKRYEAKKNASDEEFKKAIPYIESAYEVNEKAKVTPETTNEISKNRRTTLDVLKTLYYRLKLNDQFDRIKKLQESAQ
jgi:Flp pilus assembly protein TadD